MSDSNDKKPASLRPGQSTQDPQSPSQRGEGPVYDDPLAELDRIVNQDFDFSLSSQSGAGTVSNEELQKLEQDLIRELKGPQGQVTQANPADASGYVAPRAQDEPLTEPRAAPIAESARAPEPVIDPLDRPHPLAARMQQPSPEPEPQTAGRVSETPVDQTVRQPIYAAEPPASGATETSAPDVPPMPTSDSPGRSMPAFDDWASVINQGQSSPGQTEERQAEPETTSAPLVRAAEEPVATSGSYGQLRRSLGEEVPGLQSPIAPAAQEASAPQHRSIDPLGSYRPGEPSDQTSSGLADVAPSMPAGSWHDQVAAPQTEYDRRYQDHVHASASASEADPYARPAVPEVTAPVASDPATDPYASFSQTAADPYDRHSSHQPEQGGYAAAPSVDVTGQQSGYAPQVPGYDQAGSYQDPLAGQQYGAEQPDYGTGYPQGYNDQNGALSEDYPMASGPHGSYADPGVAQAAAESAPHLQEDDYAGMDPEFAAAATEEPRKSRKGLIAALAAIAVVAVGGLVAWGWMQGGGDSETPVIAANTDPVKETPEDPGGKVIPHQNKTVYNRIDGTESDEGPSNLMPATEQPMTVAPDGQPPRVISLSGGQSEVQQNSGASTPGNVVKPKEVRTVVVRPDGTIVTSNEPPAAEQASVDQQLLDTTPSEQAMTQTFNNGIENGVAITPANPNPLQDPGAAAAGADTGPLIPRNKPAELVALQAAAEQAAATQPAAPAQPAAPVTRPVAQPAAPQPATQPVTQPAAPAAQQPLVLAPPNSQAAFPAANSASGAFTVQITSQRTPEQARASFNNIQSRLSSVLGGFQPDIKQADLGARGTYYRVRVGSFDDRASANSFCNSIKAAGGDCLVARR